MVDVKTVGVGIDNSPMSISALKWAANDIANANDKIVLIHVLSGKSDPHSQKKLWKDTGSPLIPLEEFKSANVTAQYGVHPDAEIFDILDGVLMGKKVVIEAKVYWGDPREKLCDAVDDLKLDSLVVGSRGLGMVKRLWLGSVSHHVVNHASCPVTVVKEPKDQADQLCGGFKT